MTRLEIRNQIRRRLGETTAAFWEDAELNSWINDACTDLAFRAKCLPGNSKFSTLAGTSEYVISALIATAIISLTEVYYLQDGTTWKKIDPINRTELDTEYPNWKSDDAGTPLFYYFDREEAIFGLYPKPNTVNAGTDYGEMYFQKAHVDLNADGESPQLSEYLQPAIVDYVVATGHDQRGWGDKANDAWTKYYTKIRDYRMERHREKEDEEIIMKNYRNI